MSDKPKKPTREELKARLIEGWKKRFNKEIKEVPGFLEYLEKDLPKKIFKEE